MFRNLTYAAALIGLGIYFGRRMRIRQIEGRVKYMERLAETIKDRNNQMVNNLAQLYIQAGGDPSKYTEIDEILMNMWID